MSDSSQKTKKTKKIVCYLLGGLDLGLGIRELHVPLHVRQVPRLPPRVLAHLLVCVRVVRDKRAYRIIQKSMRVCNTNVNIYMCLSLCLCLCLCLCLFHVYICIYIYIYIYICTCNTSMPISPAPAERAHGGMHKCPKRPNMNKKRPSTNLKSHTLYSQYK